MTINSISSIASTPFCGLGTQTFNVPTTGLWTAGVTAFIPWQTSDQPSSVANPELAEVQTITTVADVSGSLNSTFWTFNIAGNNNTGGNNSGYYVWYNINSAGTDPAPAGLTGIAVAGATGVTANNIAAATRTAIAAAVPASGNTVLVTGATNNIILTNTQYGAATAAANGTASPGFSYAVGTTGTYGYASGLTITVKHNTTVIATYSQPTPTQPLMGGNTQVQCTASDTITVITSSLATADAGINAVKGIINIFAGPV